MAAETDSPPRSIADDADVDDVLLLDAAPRASPTGRPPGAIEGTIAPNMDHVEEDERHNGGGLAQGHVPDGSPRAVAEERCGGDEATWSEEPGLPVVSDGAPLLELAGNLSTRLPAPDGRIDEHAGCSLHGIGTAISWLAASAIAGSDGDRGESRCGQARALKRPRAAASVVAEPSRKQPARARKGRAAQLPGSSALADEAVRSAVRSHSQPVPQPSVSAMLGALLARFGASTANDDARMTMPRADDGGGAGPTSTSVAAGLASADTPAAPQVEAGASRPADTMPATVNAAADAAEATLVRTWLASRAVTANSGIMHLAALLFETVLSEALPTLLRPAAHGEGHARATADDNGEADKNSEGGGGCDGDGGGDDHGGGGGNRGGEAGSGWAWLLSSTSAESRARLGRGLLRLEHLLNATGPTSTDVGTLTEHVDGTPPNLTPCTPPVIACTVLDCGIAWRGGGTLWQAQMVLAVLELELDAAAIALQPTPTPRTQDAANSGTALAAADVASKGLPAAPGRPLPPVSISRQASATLVRLSDRLDYLETMLRSQAAVWPSEARQQSYRVLWCLWLRMHWARARCDELRGRAAASINELSACSELLPLEPPLASESGLGGSAAAHEHPTKRLCGEGVVRALPLLLPPLAISAHAIREAEARQTQHRLLQSAQAALRSMHVHTGACAGSEYECELRVGARRADPTALARCHDVWDSVIAFASGVTMESLAASQGATAAIDAPRTVCEVDLMAVSLRLLHICWCGLGEHHRSRPRPIGESSAVDAVAADPNADNSIAAGIANADAIAIAALLRGFAALIECYERALHQALLDVQRSAAADAIPAAPSPDQTSEPRSPQRASTTAMSPSRHCASSAATASMASESTLRLTQRMLGWVLQLIQAIDTFRRTAAASPQGAAAAETRGPPEYEAAMARWEAAADRLLPRLASIARLAISGEIGTTCPSGAQLPASTSRPLAHHALACYSKVACPPPRPRPGEYQDALQRLPHAVPSPLLAPPHSLSNPHHDPECRAGLATAPHARACRGAAPL